MGLARDEKIGERREMKSCHERQNALLALNLSAVANVVTKLGKDVSSSTGWAAGSLITKIGHGPAAVGEVAFSDRADARMAS